ncbi:importin subunit beta-1 [Theileria orientalis strain Shintoku]|uniref:Importin subunit beta-1 n=1 Tax=Theileria orientalis strain Shintoku TaxID=869250 RepID=J7MEJ1_THEOR|nr:importin subunit beta-1 [Theileria orientalis strain Shintoku]PVC50311.1 importin subunit beta-1 [Theileria orientalis]BAM38599.1 importin subunit beta-1 [Theileria orientalis strain Shintoku]|eukprot:XP_009688900.1 importin subunit beta-1 [Theileria orientalis strain Shintoku]
MMMNYTILSLLDKSLDPNSGYFDQAQRDLEMARKANLAEYISSMAQVILNPEASPGARHLAGIMLKNSLEFKTEEDKMNYYNTTRETLHNVKSLMVNVMRTGPDAQSVLASCAVVARIALIELERNTWPEFFEIILTMVESQDFNQTRNSLMCLSYFLEDVSNLYEQKNINYLTRDQVNRILTSVVKGTYIEEPQSCKLSLKCLQNMVYFINKNMEVKDEREVIVEAVCRRCKSQNQLEVRMNAYDSLVQLVSEHYAHIMPLMEKIVPFLWEAIDSQVEEIAIPAFEFWNTVCEIEMYNDQAQNTGRTTSSSLDGSSQANCSIIKQVIPYLLPKILFTMTLHKYEDMDMDAWTLPMAAGICLSLCSQTVKNDIVRSVLEFINENFQSSEWNKREAAVLAYGYIMEGPDTETLRILVNDSFRNLCDVLMDSSIAVRDTAAWTISRIATFHCGAVLGHLGTPEVRTSNMHKIVRALFDEPRVAVNICFFLHELAEHINEYSKEYNHLDNMFLTLCRNLIDRSKMADSMESNLFRAIYDSLCSLIAGVSDNSLDSMKMMVDHFIPYASELTSTNLADEHNKIKLQSVYGVIQLLVTRVGCNDKLNLLMESVFKFLSVELDEDALLTLAAVVSVVKFDTLAPFVPNIVKAVLMGLEGEYSRCKICIGIAGDISRSLESNFVPYLDTFMPVLVRKLQDPNDNRRLKPPIIVCIGDIALAVAGSFAKYVQGTMSLLIQAASTTYDMGPPDSDEWFDFVKQLQESCLHAFSGIVLGLKAGGLLHMLRNYVNAVLKLANDVVSTPDQYFDANLFRLAVSLTGDLVLAFGADLSMHLVDSPFMNTIVARVNQLEAAQDPSAGACREGVVWLRSLVKSS